MGIFEGLLLLLAAHAALQYLFMRKKGKNTREIVSDFKSSLAHN